MKVNIISILIALCTGISAQVVDLPEVNITAESSIQAYLYKKSMRFGSEVPAYDSIPAFLPRLRQVTRVAPRVRQKPPLTYFLVNGASTEGRLNNHLSYYPRNSFINIIFAEYNPEVLDRGQKTQDLELGFTAKLGVHRISAELTHQYASDQDIRQSNLCSEFNHMVSEIDLGDLQVRNPNTRIGFDSFSQESSLQSRKKAYPLLLHNSTWRYSAHSFDLNFLLQEGNQALHVEYNLPQQRLFLEDISLGVMTDFHNITPTLNMSIRPILPKYNYLLITNKSGMLYQPWIDRFIAYKHLLRSEDEKIALNLYNLQAEYYRMFPIAVDLRSVRVSAGSSYIVNDDLLVIDGNHVRANSTDRFSNYLRAAAIFETKDAVLTHSMGMNFQYLPCSSYRRVPYEPLVNFTSVLSFVQARVRYSVALNQNYNIVDARYKHIPEDVDLSISADYQINDQFQIAGGIRRVFGSKASAYDGLLHYGRELWLELRSFL